MSFGRITNLMVSQQMLGEINQSQQTLANTEEQLSTGLSINEPSDNPYGAQFAVQLQGQLSGLSDYSNNITDATSWTQTGTTALSTIQKDVQTAQELVTEAGNGSNSSQNLAQIGQQISQLVSSIQSAANTQYNGQYVFSGTSTGTPPYDAGGNYQGSTSMVTRAIGPGASATVTVNLSSVLGTSSTTGLLGTLSQIAQQLSSGTSTSALNTTDLTALQAGSGQLSALSGQLGGTQDQLAMASSTIQDMQTSVTAELSNDQDVNMASAMTAYSNEQASFTAALKAGASIVQTSLMNFLSGS